MVTPDEAKHGGGESHPDLDHAQAGDWLVVDVPGGALRRGRIDHVYGTAGRRHFEVQWGNARSSLLYPDPQYTEIIRHQPTGASEPGGA